MTATHHLQLTLSITAYIIVSLTTTIAQTIQQSKHSMMMISVSYCFISFLFLDSPRINQKILLGPHHINTHPGEIVQLPCIVSKQPNAIVTWCWNDFCTLGKTKLLQRQTTHDGPITTYQYTSYPRFRLSINERLSM